MLGRQTEGQVPHCDSVTVPPTAHRLNLGVSNLALVLGALTGCRSLTRQWEMAASIDSRQ